MGEGRSANADFFASLRNDNAKGQEQTTATTKYGGLSPAQRTVELSVASVEMRDFGGGMEENKQRQKQMQQQILRSAPG
jgi:hypothetical protein